MIEPDIQVIKVYRNFFTRNKDHKKLLAIIKEDRERILLLNTHHNIIEIHFWTGSYHRINGRSGMGMEKTDIDWFGVSYEILDALFEKYKDKKTTLIKLAKFCMRSKSKTYWLKLKTTPLAEEIMAAMLGGPDEEV